MSDRSVLDLFCRFYGYVPKINPTNFTMSFARFTQRKAFCASSAAPIAPVTWLCGETSINRPSFFSSALTTPMFLATPPVIMIGALRPVRLAMATTRAAMDSWIPAMMFSLFSPVDIRDMTSDSANTVQRLLIFEG